MRTYDLLIYGLIAGDLAAGAPISEYLAGKTLALLRLIRRSIS